MISQETAGQIWNCYREIEAGEKLLADMASTKAERERGESKTKRLRDAFGRERGLTLGVPCGDDSHRILDVAPDLAVSVIRAHIANRQAELVEANEIARNELSRPRKTG